MIPNAPVPTLTDDQTVIFLHLMKTGGRSLVHILKRNYHRDVRFHCGQRAGEAPPELHQLDDAQKRSLKLVHGHIEFGIHELLPQSTTYITLLRHPVDRVISHYYYALHTQKHYTHDLVNTQSMTLKDYVSYGLTDLNNGQTRKLAGRAARSIPFGSCPRELLDQAKANLDRYFLCAGLTERFDEFLLVLKQALGLQTYLYTRSNVTTSKPGFDQIREADLELIRHYNSLDLELYAYVSQIFEAQVQALGAAFQSELNFFQGANAQYAEAQRSLSQAKTRLRQARKRLQKTRKTRDALQADVTQAEATISAAMTHPYGQLWQRWRQLKGIFGSARH